MIHHDRIGSYQSELDYYTKLLFSSYKILFARIQDFCHRYKERRHRFFRNDSQYHFIRRHPSSTGMGPQRMSHDSHFGASPIHSIMFSHSVLILSHRLSLQMMVFDLMKCRCDGVKDTVS